MSTAAQKTSASPARVVILISGRVYPTQKIFTGYPSTLASSLLTHGDAGLEEVVVDRVAAAGDEPQPGAHRDDADGGRGAPRLLPAHDGPGQSARRQQHQAAP